MNDELREKICKIVPLGIYDLPKLDALMSLIEAHTAEAVREARIREHELLWEAVPSDTEHVGTVRDISNLMKLKLEAHLTQSTNKDKEQ